MSAKKRRESRTPGSAAAEPSHASKTWERAATAVAVVFIVALFARFALHAGGLWRDEVETAHFTTLPSFRAILDRLYLGSFPLFGLSIIRTWSAIVGTSDAAYRLLGFLIALALLGALFAHARSIGIRATPWVALLLFAANPVSIRAIESIRPYGIGCALIVLTHALVWRATERPTRWRLGAAAGVAVLSVQTVYQNAILLAAICVAASAVAWIRGRRRAAAIPLGLGLAAATSLVPYARTIMKTQGWAFLNRDVVSLDHLLSVLSTAVASAGPAAIPLWVVAGATAIVAGARRLGASASHAEPSAEDDRALYGAFVLVASTGGYLAFLRVLQMPTQTWYYVTPLAIAAVSIDTVLHAMRRRFWNARSRAVLAGVVIVLTIRAAWSGTAIRQTNGDLVAAALRSQASGADLVLVNPWYFAITLRHYDPGPAMLVTVPPLDDVGVHRYDLFMKEMQKAAPMDPVLAQIGAALQRGGRVWLVGGLELLPDGVEPQRLPPAPVPPWGWSEGAYQSSWSGQMSSYLMSHARDLRQVPIPIDQPVNPVEQLPVCVFSGWRDRRPANPAAPR